MSDLTANERSVQHPGQLEIRDELAFSGQEAKIFPPR
jgi:hypothetical protein